MAFACLEITSVPNILAVCVDVSSLLFSFMSCCCEKGEFSSDELHARY